MKKEINFQSISSKYLDNINIVPINKIIGNFCQNDLGVALMLTQIVYWCNRTKDTEGWFYKKHNDWRMEVPMSLYSIRKAIRIITQYGWIETKLSKIDDAPITHYRITEKLTNDLELYLQLYKRSPHDTPEEIEQIDRNFSANYLMIPDNNSDLSKFKNSDLSKFDKSICQNLTNPDKSDNNKDLTKTEENSDLSKFDKSICRNSINPLYHKTTIQRLQINNKEHKEILPTELPVKKRGTKASVDFETSFALCPEVLKNKFPELAQVWRDWIMYRREIRHPLTLTSARMQFKKLVELFNQDNRQNPCKIIEKSIQNGWQGIFGLSKYDLQAESSSAATPKNSEDEYDNDTIYQSLKDDLSREEYRRQKEWKKWKEQSGHQSIADIGG